MIEIHPKPRLGPLRASGSTTGWYGNGLVESRTSRNDDPTTSIAPRVAGFTYALITGDGGPT